ncbi:liprin-beta-2 isoform X5 [Anopheles aquasalis]|uniref:liprin-beta-2 isoform X5 n=1 Tax=Anopheles aquasalis TaxID=42839 RepID=UPI00215AE358|nr:liprin-beta-2 isoform X5 [Anopheles aquasalis]
MELPSASSPGSSPLQTHSSAAAAAAAASSRSRCHPVICGDVMRLETIRERNSAYSEDGGEFIDLPLPPVPPPIQKPALPPPRRIHGAAPPAPEELVEPAVCKQPMGYDGLMSRAANDYLCSRLRDFEEEDGPIGNGFIGEGDCVEEIILKPTISDDDDGTRGGRTFPEQEDGLKSIDSSRSNTLRKSSWSVTSTASTGEGAGDGDDGYRYRYADESGSDDEEDDGEDGERLSGYRDKSPFLRSISQSPVERRYQRRQQTATVAASHHHRRRKPPSSSGPSGHPAEPSSSSGGGSSSGQRRHRRSRSGEQQQECEADDSTCCDDDFTWVRTQGRGEAPKASVESDRRSSSRATTAARSVARDQHQRAGSVALTQSAAQSLQRQTSADAAGPSSGPSGKPPRPARETGGSLDRRRHLSSSSRHERDSKSRSTHSLKEKSSSSEFPKHESMSSNVSLNSKEHHHDSGSYNHYNSSGSGSQHHHPTHRPQPTRSQRQSPSIWEPPPPPPLSHWDPHYYWGYQHHQQHQSREELRLIDHYHRRQQELYRYGSSSALGSSQDLSCAGGGCCNRNYYPPPPPLPAPGSCCSCDHHRSHWNTDGQRQDTDERLRRLQTDKEALALQVKTLTEQVQTLTAKIGDLERTVKEKNQLLANAEDLLQRVSVFANTVGIQIDKQKEMLSRSSLETQKLELMSAMSELKLQQAALERENLELRTNFVTSSSGSMGLMNGSLTNGTGTAVLSNVLNNNSITPGLLRRPQIITNTRMVGMSASTPGTSLTSSPMHHGSHGSLPQPAISPITPKTPPATYRQRVDVHYSSLPRQAFATTLSTVSTSSGSSTATDSNANPKRNVAFAETENANEDRTDGSLPPRSFTPQPAPSPSMSNKLKTIFGKIKRSNSGTLDDLSGAEGEFKRGGVRATAGARLGWSGTAPYRQPEKPFREWPLDALCHWFDHLGLGMYEEDLRRWLGVGSTAPAAELLKASPVDVEKELNLRHPMHRKKIVLALADIGGTEEEDELFKNAGKLDTAWILRWLEDVGLPQYRDTFTAARVDGRMLHKLTMDDLVHLQVSSCLHVASLRRAIQVMRSEKWNADCLVRRPLPPDTSHAGKDEVRLWTALRVHEWLRAVDLAEYSPNLRGSGVHGALMVFEVKFTAELFADLLSIPSSKTLLRRHLATHFKDLLGRDVIQVKREAENTLGFQPLTISAKIKTPKKSQFSLKRKKSTKGQLGGDEWSDYVCPMGGSGQEAFPVAASASAVSNHSAVAAVAANAFTSNASSANTNNVTSIGQTLDADRV